MAELGAETEKAVVETVAVVAKDVYSDIAKPGLAEIGKAIGTVVGLINTGLGPIRILNEGARSWQESSIKKIAEHYASLGTPPERQVPPDGRIVMKSLPSMAVTEGRPEIQDMFARLIATSMDSEKAATCHPSFPGIIEQLSSDDAHFLKNVWIGNSPRAYRHTESRERFSRLVLGMPGPLGMTVTQFELSELSLKRLDLIDEAYQVSFAYLQEAGFVASILDETELESLSSDMYNPRLQSFIDPEVEIRTKIFRKRPIDVPFDRPNVPLSISRFKLTELGEHFCRACIPG